MLIYWLFEKKMNKNIDLDIITTIVEIYIPTIFTSS